MAAVPSSSAFLLNAHVAQQPLVALEKSFLKLLFQQNLLLFVQPGYYIPPKQLDLLNRIDELETQVSELQGLKAQALDEQDRSRLTETVDVLKARLERLERAFGSRVVAARAE